MAAEVDMAKPIPTSRQGTDMSSKMAATTKTRATHTPHRQATPTLHNPLRHNKLMEGDSNKEAMKVDTAKLRQRVAVALHIQPVLVRRAAVTVRSMLKTISEQELMITSWGK